MESVDQAFGTHSEAETIVTETFVFYKKRTYELIFRGKCSFEIERSAK